MSSIRKAEAHETVKLADIAYEAWETGILPILVETPGLKQSERRRLRMAVQEMLDRIIVAEEDGVVMGWCCRARGRAYIPYLFVAPEFQGRGIGSMLLRRMESMLELAGASRVYLETPADNVRTVRFYEHHGYRILALKPDGRPGTEPYMSVWLEKMLHPFQGRIEDIAEE